MSLSDYFYRLRGFAIISVAYAHSLTLSSHTPNTIGKLFGLIGVPLFLICSGYFFRKQKIDWGFAQNKLRSIVVPWLIWGSFAYGLSVVLSTTGLSLSEYIDFILGHGSWLYYVPVYLLIILVYNFFSGKYCDAISLLLCAFSNFLTFTLHWGTMDSFMTFYQNPLNFIGFFTIGKLMNEKQIISLFVAKPLKFTLGGVILATITTVLFLHITTRINYINPLAIVFELSAIMVLMILNIRLIKNTALKTLGRYSYILYFLHMQLGIAVTNRVFTIVGLNNDWGQLLLKPLCVIFVTMVIVFALNKVLCVLHLNKLRQYIGLPK